MTVLAGVAAQCWLATAAAFNLPPGLLYAIAEIESAYDSKAVAQARNGTRSVGLMQINSSWFPTLKKFGIAESDLTDPCTNMRVGGWILAQEVRRHGPTWEAIGAYYAGPYSGPKQSWRLRHYHGYANRVLKAWRRFDSLIASQASSR